MIETQVDDILGFLDVLMSILGVGFRDSGANRWKAETYGGTTFRLVWRNGIAKLSWVTDSSHRFHEDEASTWIRHDEIGAFLMRHLAKEGFDVKDVAGIS